MKNNTENIKHAWSVVCQSSIIDQQTNNISINAVLEQFTTEHSKPQLELFKKNNPTIGRGIPVSFTFQVVSLWQSQNPKTQPSGDVTIELFDSIGDSMQKIDFRLVFEAGKARMRTIITSPVLVVSETGLYHFKVSIKETDSEKFVEVAEIPLEVGVTTKEN